MQDIATSCIEISELHASIVSNFFGAPFQHFSFFLFTYTGSTGVRMDVSSWVALVLEMSDLHIRRTT